MGLQRPPAIKMDVDGLLEAYPAADGQAFAHEIGPAGTGRDQVPEDQGRGQEERADQLGGATLPEEFAKVMAGDPGPVFEIVLERLADQALGLRIGRLAEHDLNAQVRTPFMFPGPAQDEFFGIMV